MLSYLTPSMHPALSSTDSAPAICSISSNEGNKSLYPSEDDTDRHISSSRISYTYSHPHQSPVPFGYSYPSTPTYGFNFSFYDEMSPFPGKYEKKTSDEKLSLSLKSSTLFNRCLSTILFVYSYNKTHGSKHRC